MKLKVYFEPDRIETVIQDVYLLELDFTRNTFRVEYGNPIMITHYGELTELYSDLKNPPEFLLVPRVSSPSEVVPVEKTAKASETKAKK